MGTYAIIETGGRQVRVEPGRYLHVEKLPGSEGDSVEFSRVCLLAENGQATIGTPHLAGVKVIGKILRQGRGPKIIVFKMRPKKHYRRKRGHRQPFTRVMIEQIQSSTPVGAQDDPGTGNPVEKLTNREQGEGNGT